jgi:hypothetical protein
MQAQNQTLVKMKEIMHFFNRYPSKHKVSWQLIVGFSRFPLWYVADVHTPQEGTAKWAIKRSLQPMDSLHWARRLELHSQHNWQPEEQSMGM